MKGEEMEEAKERLKEVRGGSVGALADFLAMQAEMRTVPKSKDGYNFKYAPYEKIAEVCFPTMWGHGFFISHRSEITADGAAVCTTLTHAASGRTWESRCPFDAKAKDQDRGKSLTYGKRYNTALLLGISIEGEPDSDDEKQKPSAVSAGDF